MSEESVGTDAAPSSGPQTAEEIAIAFLLGGQEQESLSPTILDDPVLAAEIATEVARTLLPEKTALREELGIQSQAVTTLLRELLRSRELPFSSSQILVLVAFAIRGEFCTAVFEAINLYIEINGTTPAIDEALDDLIAAEPHSSFRHIEEARRRRDPIQMWRSHVDEDSRDAWAPLLELALTTAGKSRPTRKFLREASVLIEQIGDDIYRSTLSHSIESFQPQLNHDISIQDERERELLRGLIWASSDFLDDALCSSLADFALRCYRKVPDYGPLSPKLGNAAAYALSHAGGVVGLGPLARVLAKVKYPSAKKQIDRYLSEAAERAGVTRDELDEISVPDFGLDDGVRQQTLGEHTAQLVLVGTKAELRWLNAKGKPQKTVPKAVKESHADELKDLKREVKELGGLAEAQVQRLERLWLRPKPISVATLKSRYFEHPVVGPFAKRLIWALEVGDGHKPVIWLDGRFVSLTEEVDVDDDASARLWHPIEMESQETALVWRDWLAERGINQPFCQLYRDVYRAENEQEDGRLTGHILLQSALISNCKRDGWSYQLQGHWDSHNVPFLRLPQHGLVASFDADAIPHKDDDYTFRYLISGPMRFNRLEDGGFYLDSTAAIPLDTIEPRVFSEVMRSVATIISRCTIAVDEGFEPSGLGAMFGNYWRRSAWGELAPAAFMRAQVLSDVLPRTILRDVASLDGRWLVIRTGEERHRIHVGSGLVEGADGTAAKIRLTPKAQRSAEEVFLPFEGDAMLRKILARALVVAGLV